ncbi:hypothetical protein [Haloplasma contractile]|uniref:Uncharacterized protein n=1 Tax=Haloplasma contractile SSD-17B TaxID=1033810 RepID=U2DQF9_9MOLU|nr:hypothetical protein [Haloplasma contractile]ERJ10857.1 hypothetical protein HLPCO_003190 [Haloplasma contractile SSD-17B]
MGKIKSNAFSSFLYSLIILLISLQTVGLLLESIYNPFAFNIWYISIISIIILTILVLILFVIYYFLFKYIGRTIYELFADKE